MMLMRLHPVMPRGKELLDFDTTDGLSFDADYESWMNAFRKEHKRWPSDEIADSDISDGYWLASELSDESDASTISGSGACISASGPQDAQETPEMPESSEGPVKTPDATLEPVSASLQRVKRDLESFHADRGEDAVPQRKKGVSKEEFALAKRLATLRTRFPDDFSGADLAFVSIILDRYSASGRTVLQLKEELEQFRAERGKDAVPQRTTGTSSNECSLAHRIANLRSRFPGNLEGNDLALARSILGECKGRQIGTVMQECGKSLQKNSFRARLIHT